MGRHSRGAAMPVLVAEENENGSFPLLNGHFIFLKAEKQKPRPSGRGFHNLVRGPAYIMPPIPPMPLISGMAGAFSSFSSLITHSVVRSMEAIEAAFSSATRVTLVGSITPAASRFS